MMTSTLEMNEALICRTCVHDDVLATTDTAYSKKEGHSGSLLQQYL